MTARICLGVAALGVALLTAADLAAGCSCLDRDERDRLESGEVAVLGRVLARDPLLFDRTGQAEYRYRIRVTRSVNARLGAEVEVLAQSFCGAPFFKLGSRVAMFLRRARTGWVLGGCGQVSVSRLRRALQPYPRAVGSGRVALLAAGSFGSARVMALDTDGRVLAYGAGDGTAEKLSVCPGSVYAAELVRRGGRTLVAVRELATMRVLRAVRVPGATRAIRCEDRDAATIHVAALRYGRSRPVRGWVEVARVQGSTLTKVIDVAAENVALGPNAAYVWARGRLTAVRLTDGSTRDLVRIPLPTEMTASPDGTRLAVHGYEDGLRVIDVAAGTSRVTDGTGLVGALVWVDPDRLLLRADQRLRTYTATLVALRRYGFRRGIHYTPVKERVFAVDDYRLTSLDLGSGATLRLPRLLPDRGITDLVAVPGDPPVQAERRPPRLPFLG